MAKKKVLIPGVKTIKAKDVETFDKNCNEFLRERALKEGTPPLHGKSFVDSFGEYCATFYFADIEEIDDSIKGD